MSKLATFAITFISCSVSSMATLFFAEPIAYQAGYEQAEALANWVMAPTTLDDAETEKQRCEMLTRETCWISGSFLPESMTDKARASVDTNHKLPESI